MNICYVYADTEDGWNCSEWRCAVPSRAMNRTGKHQASMLFNQDFGFNTGEAQEKCSQADIIIAQRNLFGPVHKAIQHWKARGKLVIADFDDAFDLIPPDVKNREFWIGGIDTQIGPDGIPHVNKIVPPPLTQFKMGLKMVDAATTPSKKLCSDWSTYTNTCYVPNYIEVERYTRVPPPLPHAGIQIGWGGSLSHTQSFNSSGILTALKRVCEARPQVRLVLCGDKRNYDEMPVPASQKVYQPYVPVDQWPEVVSTFDIGLAPLYGAFDDRRSWIKILEYMIMKIPWIASDGPAYADQRQFGTLIKNGPGNWERALLDTIDHLEERKAYAAGEPYQYALKQGIDANIEPIINLYESIREKAQESVLVKPQTLGLCMIVKDEAADLARCLDSVQGVVNELIVVDTGSKDNTSQIAAAYEAELLHFDWINDFSAARNFALDHVKSDWILVLDADDVLEKDSIPALNEQLSRPVDGVRIRYRNLQPAGDLCRYQDQPITRLFRNRVGFRYEGTIHEQITPSILRLGGKVVDSDITILHYGYTRRSVQGGNPRGQRNLSLLRRSLERTPQDAYIHYQLGITYKMLSDYPQASLHLAQALKLDRAEFGNEILDEIYMKMAQIELGADHYSTTIQLAQEGLKHNPENLVTLYLLAISYSFLGEIESAYPLFLHIRQSPVLNQANLVDLDTVLDFCEQTLGVKDHASLTPASNQ